MRCAPSPPVFQRFIPKAPVLFFALFCATALLLPANASARRWSSPQRAAPAGPRLTSELTGTIATHDGERVRLATDLGSIVIRTQDAEKLDYRVHLETDGSRPHAQELLKSFTISARDTADGILLKAQAPDSRSAGRLWATLEITIPKNVSLDVSTGGGNIEASEINGRVALVTAGGNITAGNIGGPARLDTGGGNIVAKNVSGELLANTGGGHISIGSVAGNATLHTGGGHIRVTSIEGTAHLSTGGGNVVLERSGGELTAETAGGEIEIGEAAGLVRAKTGGGGIRVVRFLGPTNLQTSGGSIYLTQVDSPVRASTGAGGITAWFVSPPKAPGACELEASDGDIVVHLPREFPVTIDAQVEKGSDHSVVVDPAFPLKVSYDAAGGPHAVRAEGALNGGGELIRLRTVAGNIRVVLSDSGKQNQIYKQQMEQLEKQLQSQLRRSLESLWGDDVASHP
jgi:hypothetical protein